MVEIRRRIGGAVVDRPLPAVDLPELRAARLLPVICGCGTQRPAGLALLVAEGAAEVGHHEQLVWPAALAETPDDRAAVTGANLIEIIDAACR